MKKLRFEYRFLIIYLILGGLWIVFSDAALRNLITDIEVLTRAQTYKGWFYVAVTAILFFVLLKQHLEKLRKAEFDARESDRLKTAFLQNISHEIRTPMNGIIGFSQLLNTGDLTDEQRREYISIITKSSDRLLSILNDVIEISLIESGKIKAKNEVFDLNELMNELYDIFKCQLKPGIDFRMSKGLNSGESYISGDRVKISQIIYNLLSNASKFTEKGTIHFGYGIKNKQLEFFVSDTGIGIDLKLHKVIFERFNKEDRSPHKMYEGIGLGLAICRGNLNILGGKIWLESEPGAGSTFYFSLPWQEASVPAKNQNQQEITSSPKSVIKVLVIEDDETNFEFIKAVLSNRNFSLFHAWNGTEGVNLFNEIHPNLVILDIKLPGLNGYEILKIIRKTNPEIPVIAQTAMVMNQDRQKAIDSGFTSFLAKPYKKDELLSLIDSLETKR